MWLFWVLLIVGVVWLVKILVGSSTGNSGKAQSALDILQQRYARGEIDQQEYEQKRRDLET